jgi:hypothetical protein
MGGDPVSYNGITPHRYRATCPCIGCVLMRERSPGNALMAYQRRIALEAVQAKKPPR